MAREKIISTQSAGPEEEQFNLALRPQTLDECIGVGELLSRTPSIPWANSCKMFIFEHFKLSH